MKKNSSMSFLLAGIGVGVAVGAYFAIRNLAGRRIVANLHLNNEDLNSPSLSPAELVASHLTDLNAADLQQLKELGLSADSSGRLIENRPYRNRLELVSRMALLSEVYASIKDKIPVADTREPVKVA